ncbi:helix-turn-helix transcriptional regulator [Streptomyces sp. WG-D5]
MGLKERRKAVGYSQEGLAEELGVDRKTISRWDTGCSAPQPVQRPRLAAALEVDLDQLDVLIAESRAKASREPASEPPPRGIPAAGVTDDMIRREFLRLVAITGAFAIDGSTADAAGEAETPHAMNSHLWQVYQLARSKKAVYPLVHDQLQVLSESLARPGAHQRSLFTAAGDLFQLSGELAFDRNNYTDAAAAYTLAASVSKEAKAWDLWACSLVRHAYVDVYAGNYQQAVATLSAAERIAGRGDHQMSTRYWVASVQAEAYAGLGKSHFDDCERALETAERVADGALGNGGWLRFDGSRLAEERGARYVQLGRLDLAEQTLQEALKQDALAPGLSLRRRGAVLADLAAIGAKRHDIDQLVSYAHQALDLARASSSGYIVRRLSALRADFPSLDGDPRVAELDTELGTLNAS